MDDATREFVRRRAGNHCEYCLLPQAAIPLLAFHVEHIIAKQHLDGPTDDPDLLALACDRCNAYKGTNLTSIDPETKVITPIFHPRRDIWPDHFARQGGEIIGLTPTGRATARLLNMNAPQRVELREEWLSGDGRFA
ncbi:MAG: HNH endonuclease [Planctomycetaceae bacterium]